VTEADKKILRDMRAELSRVARKIDGVGGNCVASNSKSSLLLVAPRPTRQRSVQPAGESVIWVKITTAIGFETYNGKTFTNDYSFASFTGATGYTIALLGTLAAADDCIVVNVNGDSDISEHILTEGSGPSHPFLGEVRGITSTGKKVVFIDGYDAAKCA